MLITSTTGLLVWPTKIEMDNIRFANNELLNSIYKWLQSNNIKYQWQAVPIRWYFKSTEDATAFKLRWS